MQLLPTSPPRGSGAYPRPAAHLGLWQSRDPRLAAAAAEGERIIAWSRAVLCLLLLGVSAVQFAPAPYDRLSIARLLLATFAAVTSVGAYLLLRGRHAPPWFGFFSTAMDVTAVSGVVLVLLLAAGPKATLQGTVSFDLYFVAIAASAFRYDHRVCLSAGALAMLQYVLLVGLTWVMPSGRALYRLGELRLLTQVTRGILLGMTILLVWAMVVRARGLLLDTLRDRLTGLGNRTYFEAAARAELARCQRAGQPCTLAVLDIDRFKAVNDSVGHLNGDRVLRQIGKVLAASTRREDIIARWGGEEFLLLLPETPIAAAFARLDELRRRVGSSRVELPGRHGGLTVTISAGATDTGPDPLDLQELIQRADERLLRAKAEGRDRVVIQG